MKTFIIYCLLFVHVNMCIYIIHMFIRKSLLLLLCCHTKWVSGIRGFCFGMDYHPNRCSVRFRVSILGFEFGCTETPPDPNLPRCHPYSRHTSPLGPTTIFHILSSFHLFVVFFGSTSAGWTDNTRGCSATSTPIHVPPVSSPFPCSHPNCTL
jgi:hypothetical protein